MTSLRKTKFLVALVNATSSHGYCSCPILSLESNLVFTDPSRGSEKIPTVEYPAVSPESICTSAAGFTRWTQGQCTRFALASTSRGTNEARNETETKPRETRVLQWPCLRALNCLCLLFFCVSLLVIRSHLPKRFSRKPQPPLAISLMHRSRLELLSLEIIRRTFEVKLRLI